VVYCSSLAVQLGGLGQAAYAGANAVLDAMARDLSARSARLTVSVNWDRWREVGMAAPVADADAIAPLDGGRVLEAILALGLPQVAVSTLDLRSRATVVGEVETRVAATAFHPRPALSTDFVRPTTGSEVALAALWQDVLGLGEVGIDDNFFALGGDSLTALRMTALYRERTGVSLPVTALYAAPTIRRFLDSVQESAPMGSETVLKS
jgi:phthiocerol/phenolphthiocerol synthesis type-I polyketide synthase E